MPRGKKSTAEKVVAEVANETAAPAKKARKSATKAKAAPTTGKTAAKTTKKTVKKAETKTTVPKTKSTSPKAAAKITKKTATAKTSAPRSVKKTAKSKSDEVFIQSSGKDYALSEITKICKDAYRGGTRKQIKSIKVYVKAEKNKLVAYYVVNDSINGSVDL